MAFESSGSESMNKESQSPERQEYEKLLLRIKELDDKTRTKEENRELGLVHIRAGALRRHLGIPSPFENLKAA